MDTLQRLRENLESAQEPDPLLADCFREIEQLREQVTLLTKTVKYARHQCESMRVWGGMSWTYLPMQAGRIFNKCEEALAATEPKP